MARVGFADLRRHMGRGAWTPPSGTVAWFYGGETIEGKWLDRSGNGHHATLYSAASVGVEGITLPGGTSSYGELPSLASVFAGAQKATFACWTKHATDRGYTVLSVGTSGGVSFNLRWYYGGANNEYVLGQVDAALGQAIRQWVSSLEFVHFAVVYDGTQPDNSNRLRVYANGELLTLAYYGTIGTTIGTGVAPRIGRFSSYGNGIHDDCMFASAAFSAAEIADVIANSPGSHA